MLDGQLSLKRHRDDFFAKGGKRANYLTSLSNTKWGIPPRLFKILMTSTVHAVTDYPAEAWLYLPIPKFFLEAMASIDAICATRALGVLRNSPRLFLRQDLDLQPPDVQLTFKILGTRAILAAKLPSHPLYKVYTHARRTRPQAHKGPLHAFFQLTHANTFKSFLDIQRPAPTNPLPATPTSTTLIINNKGKAI